MIFPDGFDPLAGKAPDEPRLDDKHMAGRPAHRGGILSPGVEKPAPIIQGETPLSLRDVERLLAVHQHPRVDVGAGNAIGGEAGAFPDARLIGETVATLVTDKTDRSPFCQFCQFLG
jgi:hypothetical protein